MLVRDSVVILDEVYDAAIAALEDAGGFMCTADEGARRANLWAGGKLNRNLIARGARPSPRRSACRSARAAKFFLRGGDRHRPGPSLLRQRSLAVLTVYRARDFKDAKRLVRDILDHQGRGHSLGIHTTDMSHARELAEDLGVVRVLVNFAHTFGNGGGFDSGLGFTLSMGCGSPAKNSISGESQLPPFLNITALGRRVIRRTSPPEEELFGPFWAKYGK